MMKTVKEHNLKADDVKEIKVEVIARAADILILSEARLSAPQLSVL
jgi:hypothetical protein